jgi:hypothetical protein
MTHNNLLDQQPQDFLLIFHLKGVRSFPQAGKEIP